MIAERRPEAGVRPAREGDTDVIVALVNDAYRVESFFVAGNRIGADDVRDLIAREECFVIEGSAGVEACVETSATAGHGYFGMLAVRPLSQGQGLGRRLIAFAEHQARRAGCGVMDIKVVNLRTDLVGFYESLGYAVTGTEPYVHRPVLQPCHFLIMQKTL